MYSNNFCLFCENKGIKSPHNHTIRDFGKKDKPITCPELSKNKCTYCGKLGHTKLYCEKLKVKNERNNKNKDSKKLVQKIIEKTITKNIDSKKRKRFDDDREDDDCEYKNKILKSNILSACISDLTIEKEDNEINNEINNEKIMKLEKLDNMY
jgi:hypothetical protein